VEIPGLLTCVVVHEEAVALMNFIGEDYIGLVFDRAGTPWCFHFFNDQIFRIVDNLPQPVEGAQTPKVIFNTVITDQAGTSWFIAEQNGVGALWKINPGE
jgi:hypothetical protein